MFSPLSLPSPLRPAGADWFQGKPISLPVGTRIVPCKTIVQGRAVLCLIHGFECEWAQSERKHRRIEAYDDRFWLLRYEGEVRTLLLEAHARLFELEVLPLLELLVNSSKRTKIVNKFRNIQGSLEGMEVWPYGTFVYQSARRHDCLTCVPFALVFYCAYWHWVFSLG